MLFINPVKNSYEVTPNNSVDLEDPLVPDAKIVCRAVSVGVAGDLAYQNEEGQNRLVKNLAAGILHPIMASRILSTGTTADDICVHW